MVSNTKVCGACFNQPRGNEHVRIIIHSRQCRPTGSTEPALPIGIWFGPASDLVFASDPAELVFRDYHNRDTIIAGPPATDRAVTNEYVFGININRKCY